MAIQEQRQAARRYRAARAAIDACTEGPQRYATEEADIGYAAREAELTAAVAAVRAVPLRPRLRALLATRQQQHGEPEAEAEKEAG